MSFTVEEGEIFGILGPNGAGKTTTVECIEGLRNPDGGSIRVLGHQPRAPFVRERIGVQLQESQLQGHLKVREALELYGAFYDDPQDPDLLIEQWNLADKRTAKFKALSGGQKRRLMIALALVGNPRVAFLDELTTGLDPQSRRATWKLIKEIRGRGVAVVLVSHFMDEVEELCDRVAIFEAGRIAALNTPAGLVESTDAQQRMRFSVTAPFDVILRTVTGVQEVHSDGNRVSITGAGDFPAAVTVLLAGRRILVSDLRIDSRTLDDAYVALTGNDALREETRRWSDRTGVPAEVITTGTMRPMHPDVEVTLLRTAQEALANVAKHAEASHVGLALSYMEDVVTLDVRDDGVGFAGAPPASTKGGGFGLTAMRQRVKQLAGSLEIESEPGGGTAISASVPAISAGGVQ